jgi:hypothetical protein
VSNGCRKYFRGECEVARDETFRAHALPSRRPTMTLGNMGELGVRSLRSASCRGRMLSVLITSRRHRAHSARPSGWLPTPLADRAAKERQLSLQVPAALGESFLTIRPQLQQVVYVEIF